jgi:hypothetical protein
MANRIVMKRRVDQQRKKDSFDFKGLITKVADKVGLGDEVAKVTSTLDQLKPLESTMKAALTKAGIQVPTDFTSLVNSFSNNIVKKAGKPVGSVTDIMNYVNDQVQTMNNGGIQTSVDKTIANTAIETVGLEKWLSNPMLWVGVVGIILTAILIAKS